MTRACASRPRRCCAKVARECACAGLTGAAFLAGIPAPWAVRWR